MQGTAGHHILASLKRLRGLQASVLTEDPTRELPTLGWSTTTRIGLWGLKAKVERHLC